MIVQVIYGPSVEARQKIVVIRKNGKKWSIDCANSMDEISQGSYIFGVAMINYLRICLLNFIYDILGFIQRVIVEDSYFSDDVPLLGRTDNGASELIWSFIGGYDRGYLRNW